MLWLNADPQDWLFRKAEGPDLLEKALSIFMNEFGEDKKDQVLTTLETMPLHNDHFRVTVDGVLWRLVLYNRGYELTEESTYDGVFYFEELSPKAQERALSNYRDINTDFDQWADATIDDEQFKLSELGFGDVDISYSGFSSQGDGASFTTSRLEFPALLKYLKIKPSKGLKQAMDQGELSGKIVRGGSNYFHENTVSPQLQYDGNDEAVAKEVDILYERIQDEVRELSRKIYKHLEEDYSYLQEDEQIKDTIISNAYEFNKDGSRI